MAVRKTPKSNVKPQELNEFNQNFRRSKVWNEFMSSRGYRPGQSVRLSDRDREEFKNLLASRGLTFEKGMEIDQAGNFNQNEGFGKQAKRWGPIAGATALTLFGVPGVFPGMLNAGTSGLAGAGSLAEFGAPFTASNSAASMSGLGSLTSFGAPVAASNSAAALGLGKGGGMGLEELIASFLGGGAKKEKGIGGKLIDALISPSTIVAGLGAGLSAFGGEDEDPRLDPERIAHQDAIKDKLLKLVAAKASEPRTFRAIPDIPFSPNIPGMPFDIGQMFQGRGLPEFTKRPGPGTQSVLDELTALVGRPQPSDEDFF